MNQICCLNPDCYNPPVPNTEKFCPNCGTALMILRNRYRPIKRLGGGGFGKTYLAEDIDNLNGKCVIKQLAPNTQNTYALKKATELFEEEAKRLKNLEHPQIPKLQAYFNQDNRLYLIQDFIAGEDLLTELNNQGNFTEQKIRELLLSLLPVLQIVHDQKIIHRDIKPENIMRRHSDGRLFLIDFGASKEVQGTVKPGTKIGSYGYAAIEQMEDREVYPASDLFSIGASCFHLLTGVYPGNLWNRQGYSWTNNWRSHLPQPVTVELGKILDKLLQLEYQSRYQSATEVLRVLQTPPQPKPQPPQPPKIQTPIKPQPPISQPTNSAPTRRSFLQYAGLFTGGVIVSVIGQNLLTGNKGNNSTPKITTSRNTPTPEITPSNNLKTSTFEVVKTNSQGSIISRSNHSANYFVEDLGNGVTLEMVEIPPGKFMMGSPETEGQRSSSESPQHQVTVPRFFMARYPLTQAQYSAIMGNNPSYFKGDNRPVETVNWNDAMAFCKKLSQQTGKDYTLPSEAQWEYACRAGTTTPFYFGESITPDLVNYNGNYSYAQYRAQTTNVGSFPPNAFGLYDMHGNVWEWCLDNWHENYINAPADGSAWISQGKYVLRGGSWNYLPENCRSANRNNFNRDLRINNIGFRVVCLVVARTL
ncbi:SUMF1/EgtB/PvdO family nonheme iron enzyme [Anabaena sp. FACHB-1237]|uniref:bifunctional serine/threonine-protein kinase/formylglycine-generating enzyme family protein n=1 Tax=Anabaena sp. FACHB-1237 TaxID=2692769 RepID=UPI00168104B9|nr:bifunctional serine/threonine-protein kinase/formylglycine-generating enzyme family protein [Anabaena sp. FACHB-1237]MBD2139304.1 SUMF1/EgtB/PvdO family nonheme iron enzyme [Anabaena sp. FACHB-1237]